MQMNAIGRLEAAVTISETLAEFLITTRAEDLPERTVDLAAMIIASTIASAALGRNIESARGSSAASKSSVAAGRRRPSGSSLD